MPKLINDENLLQTPVRLEPLMEAHEEILANSPTEMVVPKAEQISPVIENQITPKKSRKKLADVIYHFLKDQLEGIILGTARI